MAWKQALCAAAALTVAVHASNLRSAVRPLKSTGGCTGTTYDYFELVTQWDVTECMDVFSCQTNTTWFTMHGLWPSDNNGNYPCTCTNEAFDQNQVSTILTQLNKYWPSLNGPNPTFWSHEWSKHVRALSDEGLKCNLFSISAAHDLQGTCALDVLDSQLAYFSGALQARTKYDVGAALAAKGITPSNTKSFTMSAFQSATENAFGYPAVLSCDSNGNIEETTVCLDKTLSPIQCPDSMTNDCSSNTLYLPATVQ